MFCYLMLADPVATRRPPVLLDATDPAIAGLVVPPGADSYRIRHQV